jgi:NitT/TauT family transport system ATP-binding protein
MSTGPELRASASVNAGEQGHIVARGVAKEFGEVVALDGFDLELEPKSRVAVVGPSGCGKSTFLSLVAGLDECTDGHLSIDGHSTPQTRLSQCALMPQKDLLLPWRSAIDNAILALENKGVDRKAARTQARPLFEHFGLASFEDRRPAQLSGGMRQRISFLRTLLAGKPVLLLDEPFGALDALTRAGLQEWLAGALDDEPRTTVLVTHDVEEALMLSHRLVVLTSRPGRIVLERDIHIDRSLTRRELVSSPEFVALKEEALEALEV